MPYGNGAMWGMHWTGWLFWLVLLAALIYVIGKTTSRSGPEASSPSAREILDRRYAAGEISTQEYEERKAKLEGR